MEFDDEKAAGWKTITIPTVSVSEATYRTGDEQATEGGTGDGEIVFINEENLADLTMERGVQPEDTVIFDWQRDAVLEREDRADVDGRKEVTITLFDTRGEPVRQWSFTNAWPKDYDPPDLDASADGELATESITVVYDEMKRTA